MSVSCEMTMSLSQRCELRLEQRLITGLGTPKDWDFTEPKPKKELVVERGNLFIDIDEAELTSYARGCMKIAQIINEEQPDLLLISLRGGWPVARCV